MAETATALPELPLSLRSALDGLLDPDVPLGRQGAKNESAYSFIIKNGWEVTFTFMGMRERIFRKPTSQWSVSIDKNVDCYVDSSHMYEDSTASHQRLRKWAMDHATWDGAW